MSEAGDRLQKALSRAGIASRRAAEELIAAGRVRVNGDVVREMGRRVAPTDRIEVDGRAVEGPARPVYWALNKPLDVVSTARDPEGRTTVLDLVPSPQAGAQQRVYPVGRLDRDSEGLLLLTNDGELAHRLTHPRYGVEKEYHALVRGHPNQVVLGRLAEGVPLDDGTTAPAAVRRVRGAPVPASGGPVWVAVTIHEGRNRQVRRMFEVVGYPVDRLVRVRVGPIELGELPPGRYRSLAEGEVARLRRLVGLGAPATGAPAERTRAPASSPRYPGTRR